MAADLTTADVYEDASLIGQDIEKIIERFGHDAVLDLMPKVVNVLEKLELVVGGREKDKLEIAELKLENERLYLDIKREASQRRRLDEELYQISSTGEADNLKSMLVKLQDENRKLRLEYEVSANSQPVTAYVSAPGDAELMHKMKETIDNQRDNIRSKNLEIESQKNDVEAMEEQIDRLTNINQSVRRSMVAGQQRISILAKEKAELQAELRAFTRTSQSQKDSDDEEDFEKSGSLADSDSESELNGTELGQQAEEEKVQKSGDDNIEDWDEPPPKPPRLRVEREEVGDELNNNENILADKDKDAKGGVKENGLENGSNDEKQNDWEIVEQWKLPGKGGKSEERNEKAKEERTQNDKEKKDPNRPRYTKAELLEILTERNKLKEKVWALQEELKVYKPGDAEVEDDGKLNSSVTSPRRESRKEESGISRIFNIFARKGES